MSVVRPTRTARTARYADPWKRVPLALRRYWSALVVAILMAGAAARYGWAGLGVGLGVAAVTRFVLPARVNLSAHAVSHLRRPDGAPRLRARRFHQALAGCPGIEPPSRLSYTHWHRDRRQGLEMFEVRSWSGDHLGRWTGARSEALRARFMAEFVEVREVRPGHVRVWFIMPTRMEAISAEPPPHLIRIDTDVLAEPVPIGRSASGEPISVPLDEVNVLLGGIPGSGKSGILQLIVGWAALDPWCQLYLIDGKGLSELGRWSSVAAGCAKTVAEAAALLGRVEAERQRRVAMREVLGARSWRPGQVPVLLVVLDELAVYTDTTGLAGAEKAARVALARLLVDLVRLGRADRIVVVAATQRPSADVVPTAFRDLVGVRVALRCTTREQSDIALGAGASAGGGDATKLSSRPGSFILRGAGPDVVRGQAYWLTDPQIDRVLQAARAVRGLAPGAGSPSPVPLQLPPPRATPTATVPEPSYRSGDAPCEA